MKVHLSKSDIIWSYLGTIMTLCSHVIMIPLIVYFLDGDLLGLWYVFISIGAIANLFDFGFTITFARNITYCWSGVSHLQKEGVYKEEMGDTNFVLMKNILTTCKRIYMIISLFVLALFITIGTYYVTRITAHISGYEHVVAWFIYAFATFLNLYYNYYDSFLRGVGAIKQANKNRVIARIIHLGLIVLLLPCGGLIGASMAYLSYGVAFRYLGKKHFYGYQKIGENLAKVTKKFSIQESKDMFITIWYNAWRDGLIQICQYCCGQLSVIICSLYLSLTETGAYSVGQQMVGAVAALSAVLYAAYQPSLQEAHAKNNMEIMKTNMSTIVLMFIFSFGIGMVLLVSLGLPLMKYIKPESMVDISVLLGISVCVFVTNFRTIYTSYFSCTNRIVYMKAFILSSITCVILSFLFIGPLSMGVWGLIIAQFLSQAMYNFWYWPLKAHKEMNLSISELLTLGTNRILIALKKL